MTAPIELTEWSRRSVRCGEPTKEDLDLAAQLSQEFERKLELNWLRDGRLDIRTTSWVGLVRLSNLTICVRPKYVGDELRVIQMLEYASGMHRLQASQSQRTLSADGADLLELLCSMLAAEVETLTRDGLLRDYTTEEASLATLRGSLRYRDQAIHRFGQLDVLECRFDEFHADVIENQLVLAGLQAAAQLVGSDETRPKLRRLVGMLTEVASPGPSMPSFYRSRLQYTRRNERYRRAHQLSLLLLDGVGVDDIYREGDVQGRAFLIDMNVVFEDFMAQLVADAFACEPWRVVPQRRVQTVIRDQSTGKRYASIIPDLLLARGAEQVPFDCKYKLYGGNRKISTGDIYQTFVYAFALSGQSADGARAGILYPSDSPATAPVLGISQVEGPPAAVLTGIGFDVVNILNAMGNPAEWEQTLESVRGSLGRVLNGEAA